MEAARGVCFHCGQELARGSDLSARLGGVSRSFCCPGCAAAASFIFEQRLERFYQFRDTHGGEPPGPTADWVSFDREAARRRYVHGHADGSCEATVRLRGLHCAACVWLIDNALRGQPGLLEVTTSLADERVRLRYDPQQTPLSALLAALQRLGFTPRPLAFREAADVWQIERRLALRRLAVAGFGMMQVMTFAVCLYAGALDGIAPDMEQLLRYVSALVATPVVLYAARPFFISAWQGLRMGALGMDVPVAVSIAGAYLWSVWATLAGAGTLYFDSVVMFTFLLLLGRYLEMALRHRAGGHYEAFGQLLPQSVPRLLQDGATEHVTPEELEPGDRIRILAGERLAADGVVVAGVSEVDESLLSGETAPRLCRLHDTVSAGTLNLNGVLEVSVTRAGQESTLAAVARLLEKAQASRPAVADLADRVAGGFVGATLLLAAAVGLFWWHNDPARAFPAVLAVLVVTCPCALSLATPAVLAAATARLAAAGVLVTRSRALERLASIRRAVFDKTGTLTRGGPRIETVTVLDPRITEARALALAAALEAYSKHPLARAFAGCEVEAGLQSVMVAPGLGLEGSLGARRYRIGQLSYVMPCAAPQRVAVAARDDESCVYLGDEEGLLAAFTLTDTLRSDALETVDRLRQLGVSAQIASGDRTAVVDACARRLGIDSARGGLSAADKLALLKALQANGERVLMVGDGVNDAPVLAAADASAAVGGGTDVAQVSADLILMGEGLGGVVEAISTSRRALRIIRENLIWALLYNLTAVPLAASGRLQPWIAALGMSASSLLVVANALRLLPSRPQPISSAAPRLGGVLRT